MIMASEGDWTTRHLGSTQASGNSDPARHHEGQPETSNLQPAPQEMPDDAQRQNVRERDEAERHGIAPQERDSETPPPASVGDESEGARYGRDETRRNPNIDPGSEQTQPGETPPASNSATASPPQSAPTKPPKSNMVITIVVVAIVILVGLIFVGYIAGLLG